MGIDVEMDLGWIVKYEGDEEERVKVRVMREGGEGKKVKDI